MTNHLRIAINNLLKNPENTSTAEITRGNYKVSLSRCEGADIIAISHLKFHGSDEYPICVWNVNDASLNICEGKDCPSTEFVFVLRTIKKLGYNIGHVMYGKSHAELDLYDATQLFHDYL